MTQWKLVPVEPTREMIEAAFGAINYTMPEPSEDAGRVYSAMLSAAPSPDGEEDEVERVARAICATHNMPADDLVRTPDGRSIPYWREFENQATAAISAMRPAPKLTEEDRARVEELLRDALDYTGQRYAPIDTEACNEYARLCDAAHDKVREALSLIDKLTEAG